MKAPSLSAVVLLAAVGCSTSTWRAQGPSPDPQEGLQTAEPVAFFPSDELSSHATADGRFVVFVSDETGNLDVWVRDYRTDSTYPRTTDPVDDFDPAVSTDGERLVFVSRRADAKGDLFIGDVDSGDVDRLTDARTAERQPRFSVDGRSIYFTTSPPGGREYIAALDLGAGKPPRRVSPTFGFDPAPSPDGRFLIYTAPHRTAGRTHPHLVALRLADSATVAVSADDGPAGFARFVDRTKAWQATPQQVLSHHIVYVRFPDDDTGDGTIDGRDSASLWRLDLDLDAAFAGARPPLPFPLTDGSRDELFGDPAGPWLYFTETAGLDQNVNRLPVGGRFPAYDRAGDYLSLAAATGSERARWFALRCAVAKSEAQSQVHASALLQIANLHVEASRPRLAERAFEALIEATADATSGVRWSYGGIARVELIALDRVERLAHANTPASVEAVSREVRSALETIAERYRSSSQVSARVALELAEVLVDRGSRVQALDAFDQLVETYADVTYSAARAMIRRTELLGVAFDPDAIGEAYAKVLQRYPSERRWVNEAASAVVATHVRSAAADPTMTTRKALRRILARSQAPPIRIAARLRLADVLEKLGDLPYAAAELTALVAEASAAGDVRVAASALARRSSLDERRGKLDEAVEGYRTLRDRFGALPGVAAEATESITRVSLRRASIAESRRNVGEAWSAYRDVIDNDVSQVHAHRRYLALSAQIGLLGQAVAQARARAARSAKTPIARYVYGLALTWLDPPPLDLALAEIDEALALNPQFAHGYLARGWINEMLELDNPASDHLERAIEDYKIAARLNLDAEDPVTEAAVMLNLGNARWRLGAKTNDLGNVLDAFADYQDRLNSGVPFARTDTELVFWERYGRSAAWVGRWADSIAATQKAIEVARSANRTERLHQLWGNLAMAHAEAGDDVAAAEAFARFAEALTQSGKLACISVAGRGRAFTRLRSAAENGQADVRGALTILASARAAIGETEGCEPPAARVTPAVSDPNRAPLGFEAAEERALNLSLAAGGHRLRGERARAAAIEAERQRLVEAHIAAREHNASRWSLAKLFDEQPELVTPKMLRENVALRLTAARSRCSEVGGVNQACVSELNDTLTWLRERGELGIYDAEAYAVEWALGLALAAETLVAHAADRAVDPSRLRPGLLGELVAAASALAAIAGEDAAAAQARVRHAQGLVHLAGAALAPSADLLGLVAWLDQRVDAAAAFGAAEAIGSADSPVAPAARVGRMIALDQVDTASVGEAAAASRRIGRPADAARFAMLIGSPSTITATLAATFPPLLPQRIPEITAALERAAVSAVEAGALGDAIDALDRRMLLASAAGTPIVGANAAAGSDRRWAVAVARAYARVGTSSPDQAAAAHAAVREAADGDATPALRARVLGEPYGAAAVGDVLGRSEALVIPFERRGALDLIVVGTATSSDLLRLHLRTGARFADVRRAVAAARAQLTAGRALSAPLAGQLRAALLEPVLQSGLRVPETLIYADLLLGGPVPFAAIADGATPAFVHVSAPSALAACTDAIAVGADGVIALGPGDTPAMLASAVRLSTADAVATARVGGRSSTPVSERSVAEGLAGSTQALLVIEAPVIAEPAALERSAIAGWSEGTAAADRFGAELTLDELGFSPSVLVLRSLDAASARDVLRLDLALAPGGVASVVVAPAGLPGDAVRRVVARFATRLQAQGPARALAAAVAAEIAQTPAAALIQLVGSPGLDLAGARLFAARALGPARRAAAKLVQRGRYGDAVPVLRRWIRLMTAAGQMRRMALARNVLVKALLQSGDLAGAADAQSAAIVFLESSRASAGEIAKAKGELGYLLSRAGDAAAAVRAFTEATTTFAKLGDLRGQASTVSKRAQHHRARLEFAQAADAYQQVVELYEEAGAFRSADDRDAAAALTALRNLGSITLNRLSDPARAQVVYRRLRDHAKDVTSRLDATIALARVARRKGDFATAATLADEAGTTAAQSGLRDWQLDAIVESANVAWKRGDYAAGTERCRRGLALADENLDAAPANVATAVRRAHVKRKIYVQSVCGLLAMSTQDFDGALAYLAAAAALAERFDLPEEVAAQKNNIGRVYLEQGRVGDAIAAFSAARAIDARLNDRRGLAYDDRNIGAALARIEDADAEATLRRALAMSEQVKDRNNEMHARFELAELARAAGRRQEATAAYEAALELARVYDVKAIEWRIHRALGALRRDDGDDAGAESALRQAIAVARSMTGAATRTDFGPYRYAAIDDLVLLLLERGDAAEAFELAQLAQQLSLAATLGDPRLNVAAEVASAAPAAEVQARLRDGGVVVQYRVTETALAVFAVTSEGLVATTVDIGAAAVRQQVRSLGAALEAAAEVNPGLEALGALLLAPIAGQLEGRRLVALVLDDVLRYVPFAALPVPGRRGRVMLDDHVLIQAFDPLQAATALAAPMGALGAQLVEDATGGLRSMAPRPIVALAPSGDDLQPLPLADTELRVIAETHPDAQLHFGDAASAATLLDALRRPRAVVHFAGHTGLSSTDGLAGTLQTAGAPLALHRIFGAQVAADLVVLSACATRISSALATGDELRSLAEAFHIAGAPNVIATSLRVDDVAAAMLMKRFYRSAATSPVAESLRAAQLIVRRYHPHPAWWATFSLLAGR